MSARENLRRCNASSEALPQPGFATRGGVQRAEETMDLGLRLSRELTVGGIAAQLAPLAAIARRLLPRLQASVSS
jgi:hypothetical protein